jgi:hypothetical protein
VTDWTRRDVLAGLGVGAAATLVATLGSGCGGPARSARGGGRRAQDVVDVRGLLHRAVERLRGTFAAVRAHAVVASRVTAALDLRGRGVVRARHAAVVFRLEDATGRVVERALAELSEDAIDALVKDLVPGKPAVRSIDFGTPRKDGPVGGAARVLEDADWLAVPVKLVTEGEKVSNSRVVYRGAWVDTDDATIWHVAAAEGARAVDREQRLVRSRAGLLMVSWSGTSPTIGQVERGAVGGPERVVVSDDDLNRVADGALELTTPGSVPAGPAVVVLRPDVVARIADVAIGDLMTTAAWRRRDLAARAALGTKLAAAAVTVTSDPDPARYGGYHFDDEGVAAVAAPLIEAGVLRGPVGAGLRPGHTGAVRPRIGHLAWAPGTVAEDDLIDDLAEAWVIEQAGDAHVDPAAWTVTIEAGRARRVKNGARTGHVYADVELTAELPALLAGVTRIGAAVETVIARDGDAADARWRSVAAPAVVSRATLAPRRAT